MDYQEYMDALREQYEQYGDFAFLDSKIQVFVQSHRYGVTPDKVRKDLEGIAKWDKLKNEISTIDNVPSYLHALELFCTEFGSQMSSLFMRAEFVKTFQLDTKFQMDYISVGQDIIHLVSEPKRFLKGDNRQIYLELLKYYYWNYGDNMFYSGEMEKFKTTCSNHNLNILSYDIAADLRDIRKTAKSMMPDNTNTTPSNQKKQKTVNTPMKNTSTPKQTTTHKPKQTTTQANYTPPKQTTTTSYTPPKEKPSFASSKAVGILGAHAGKALGDTLISIANEIMKSL